MATTGARRRHHLGDRRAHRMELMVTGDLLDQPAIVFKQHEEAQVIEQHGRGQNAAHHGLQLAKLTVGVEVDPIHRAPLHKALGIGRQRPHPRLATIGGNQDLVVLKQVGDLLLVGLQLIKRLPDVGIHIGRVLELKHHQRQPVDEEDDVGAAGVFGPLDRELVDGQPLVGGGLLEVNEADKVPHRLAIALVLHRHPIHQQAVKCPVGRQQRRGIEIDHLRQRIFTRHQRHGGVEPGNRLPQALAQQHLLELLTPRVIRIGGHIVATLHAIAHLGQPPQHLLFQLIFGHAPSLINREKRPSGGLGGSQWQAQFARRIRPWLTWQYQPVGQTGSQIKRQDPQRQAGIITKRFEWNFELAP